VARLQRHAPKQQRSDGLRCACEHLSATCTQRPQQTSVHAGVLIQEQRSAGEHGPAKCQRSTHPCTETSVHAGVPHSRSNALLGSTALPSAMQRSPLQQRSAGEHSPAKCQRSTHPGSTALPSANGQHTLAATLCWGARPCQVPTVNTPWEHSPAKCQRSTHPCSNALLGSTALPSANGPMATTHPCTERSKQVNKAHGMQVV
jgi:hypothetical protein